MKKKIIFVFFLLLLILPILSSYTIYNASAGPNVIFRSNGLNSQITLTFPINFSRADVTSNSITFYDLTYVHPSSCNGATESVSLYNYTTADTNVTSSDVFPYTACSIVSPVTPSGGGGIFSGLIKKSFSLDKEEIKTKVQQGKVQTEELTVTNNLNSDLYLTIDISKIDDLVFMKSNEIHLGPKESKTISFEIIAQKTTPPDLYLGNIIIKTTNGEEINVLTAIEVESSQPLFDVSVNIPEQYVYVMPGKELYAEVQIYNLGEIEKTVDVNVEYRIIDSNGNNITQDEETIAVNTKIDYLKKLKIPEEAKFGRYLFYVKTTYSQKVASGSDWFNVGKPPSIPFEEAIIGLLILVIMIIVTILIRRSRKIKKQEKLPKKEVDKNALKRANIIKRGR